MPIQIRELHIKVAVNEPAEASNTSPVRSTPSPGGAQGQMGEDQRDQIIAECVEQVMNILREKSER
ncbi:MAG: hypothetical protein IPJ74_06005 [Saprospiraceae bacterium]|nr:hypothetical protein [Saprospiraceae bacterium]